MTASRNGNGRKRRMREEVLTHLTDRLENWKQRNSLLSFGPDLGLVNGTTAADIVVVTRLLKRLKPVSKTGAAERRRRSIRNMLHLDSCVPELTYDDDSRMAKARLSTWFHGFRPSYRFRAPSGASAVITGNIQDIELKLSDLKNWEASPHLLGYATAIAYSNQKLKKLVKQKFREQYPYLTMNEHFREKHGCNGYAIFKEIFKTLVNINSASRVTTVPKDNEEDRVITCVPLWDMVCQLSFMSDMREHIKRKIGYDIDTRGDLHKTLLTGQVATIDLSKASDHLSWEWVRTIWPSNMVGWLGALRPHVYVVDDGDMDIYHDPIMYAPMGCGVTFDVMTLSLLAVLRFDRSASVFGDDIIVKPVSVERALRNIRNMGMVVNTSKSFTEGKFRESCGGMYHDEIGYIESYEGVWPTNAAEWVTITNKLSKILHAAQISYELAGILIEARNQLWSTFPRVSFGGVDLDGPLRSDAVMGLTNHAPWCWIASHLPERPTVIDCLEDMWQRPVESISAIEVFNTEAGMEPCPHVQAALRFYRGVSNYETTDTRCRSVRVDGFSASPLWDVQLASVVRH